MPGVLRSILYPNQQGPSPEPLAVDLTGVFLVGITAWVVALIVTWVRWQAGDVPATASWTCVAGIVLGLLALGWARDLRRRLLQEK